MDAANKGTNTRHEEPAGLDATVIGRSGDSTPTEYWDGEIAEAAIWNVQLSLTDIEALAAGFSPLFVRPDALKAYWPMGGALSANDSDNDIAGAFNMTSSGSPTTADHPPVIIYPTYPIIFSLAGNAARAMHHYRMLRCS